MGGDYGRRVSSAGEGVKTGAVHEEGQFVAVDNQPAPTQPASPRPATSREIIRIAGAAIALVAVIIAGMSLVVSMTLAPMREDLRLLCGEITTLRRDMNDGFKAVNNEFKALREDLAESRERLTRVETLLEQNIGQPQVSESP